jgi:hypothetical protein
MRMLLLAARAPVAAAFALLAAALLLAALPPAHADAARKAKACPKGTVAAGPRRGARLCVPRKAKDPLVALEKLLPRARRGAKQPSAASKRLAKRALSLALSQASAGRALLDAASKPKARAAGLLARAAAGDNVGVVVDGLGRVTSYEKSANGVEQIEFKGEQGVEVAVRGVDGQRWEAEARDRNGAGWTLGTSTQPKVPECPTAAGDVPTPYETSFVIGKATTEHGKRTWFRTELRMEGRWHGYVGVGARAERYDLDVRGTTEQRSGVEIASTGKALRRNPTRVYRSVLRKRGLAIGTDPTSLIREVTIRGPKGTRFEQADVQPATALMGLTVDAVSHANHELPKGDERWYEQRACAKLDFTWAPSRVAKGGRADWDVTAKANDGAVVADARWTPTSACGVLSASGTSGPNVKLGVVDAARGWGIDTGNGACVHSEVTTTAGRPQPLDHSIPPEPRRTLKLAISVRYNKNPGPGNAQTHMTGTGTVTLGDAATAGELVMGSGQYDGTEWDQRVDNTCGQDMQALRPFGGRATVGAQRHDDGTITVAFTADERPFDMAWIVTLPDRGGTQTIEADQPFCGQPRAAHTTTVFSVTVTEIVDDGW